MAEKWILALPENWGKHGLENGNSGPKFHFMEWGALTTPPRNRNELCCHYYMATGQCPKNKYEKASQLSLYSRPEERVIMEGVVLLEESLNLLKFKSLNSLKL